MYREPLGFAAGLGRRSTQRAPIMHVSNLTPRVSKLNGNNGYTYSPKVCSLGITSSFVVSLVSPLSIPSCQTHISNDHQQRSCLIPRSAFNDHMTLFFPLTPPSFTSSQHFSIFYYCYRSLSCFLTIPACCQAPHQCAESVLYQRNPTPPRAHADMRALLCSSSLFTFYSA